MTVDWSRTLLLWDPRDTVDFGLDPGDFRSRGIQTFEAPYARIGKDRRLLDEILETKAEAIIFTRNEQMEANLSIGSMLGRLHRGYTCVSAIDKQHQKDQTRQCIADLLDGIAHVPIPAPSPAFPVARSNEGSFSLIFDLEQLGGARFGMPRLLLLLESYGIRATFFVTGIIAAVYPGLLQRIADGGHELGVHGELHEFLQGESLDAQLARVRRQAQELRAYGQVLGANYIFRMDELSPAAFAAAGLKYMVLFRKHVHYRTRYIAQSTRPRALRTPTGGIAFIPVGVETYGRARRDIKVMIDSSLNQARREPYGHVSILMHPFRDGSLDCLEDTQWIIRYLTGDRRLRPTALADVPRPSDAGSGAVQILYRWDGHEATALPSRRKRSFANCWWAPPIYHSRRTESLADALENQGVPVTLATKPQDGTTKVCVYPDQWQTESGKVFHDPILTPRHVARDIVKILEARDSVEVVPGPPWRDFYRFIGFHVPHSLADLVTLAARLSRRLARLLSIGPRE